MEGCWPANEPLSERAPAANKCLGGTGCAKYVILIVTVTIIVITDDHNLNHHDNDVGQHYRCRQRCFDVDSNQLGQSPNRQKPFLRS